MEESFMDHNQDEKPSNRSQDGTEDYRIVSKEELIKMRERAEASNQKGSFSKNTTWNIDDIKENAKQAALLEKILQSINRLHEKIDRIENNLLSEKKPDIKKD